MTEQNGRVDLKDIELLDWFAGQALGGMLANPHFPPQGSGEPFDQYAGRITDSVYRIAESMIHHGRRLKKNASAFSR